MDGVLWVGSQPVDGAAQAIVRLQHAGWRVVFATNNSTRTAAYYVHKLAKMGIIADDNVVSSAIAAATLVTAGEDVLVLGGDGVFDAVSARGASCYDAFDVDYPQRVDAVVVGLHTGFTYEAVSAAATAVRNGARFIGTNPDPTYPSPSGLQPGAGTVVAAVATAAGAQPVFAGKPCTPMVDAVRACYGAALHTDRTVMVGDRWSTDGRFAEALGCRFALVRSGVPDDVPPPSVTGTYDCADLAELADVLTDGV